MIKVSNEVGIHEIDGKDTSVPVPTLTIVSHWNRDELVVLQFGADGKRLTVSARDLEAALKNATNTVRHG